MKNFILSALVVLGMAMPVFAGDWVVTGKVQYWSDHGVCPVADNPIQLRVSYVDSVTHTNMVFYVNTMTDAAGNYEILYGTTHSDVLTVSVNIVTGWMISTEGFGRASLENLRVSNTYCGAQ